MADGLIFYWLSWILWIFITFLMNKTRWRTTFACWLMIGLLCSNTNFIIGDYDISLAFLVLFIGTIILHTTLANTKYVLFISFTVMIGYTAMLLWEKLAPVWMIMPRFILIPILLIMMLHLLTKNIFYMLTASLTGICAGEVIYSMILTGYNLEASIGDMIFFDQMMVLLVLIIGQDFLKTAQKKLFSRSARCHTKNKTEEQLPERVMRG